MVPLVTIIHLLSTSSMVAITNLSTVTPLAILIMHIAMVLLILLRKDLAHDYHLEKGLLSLSFIEDLHQHCHGLNLPIIPLLVVVSRVQIIKTKVWPVALFG
uniref:Uncharacterized protein n=1 Tax=Cacopsylla melanoneura TaxID=428564 RepID=A0A8D9B2J8_9HEMI